MNTKQTFAELDKEIHDSSFYRNLRRLEKWNLSRAIFIAFQIGMKQGWSNAQKSK